jgi:hypothetical protein
MHHSIKRIDAVMQRSASRGGDRSCHDADVDDPPRLTGELGLTRGEG